MQSSTYTCVNGHVHCNEFTIALSFADEIASALESMPAADLELKEKLPLKKHESSASFSVHEEVTIC